MIQRLPLVLQAGGTPDFTRYPVGRRAVGTLAMLWGCAPGRVAVGEVARLLDADPRTVLEDLARLEAAGALTTETRYARVQRVAIIVTLHGDPVPAGRVVYVTSAAPCPRCGRTEHGRLSLERLEMSVAWGGYDGYPEILLTEAGRAAQALGSPLEFSSFVYPDLAFVYRWGAVYLGVPLVLEPPADALWMARARCGRIEGHLAALHRAATARGSTFARFLSDIDFLPWEEWVWWRGLDAVSRLRALQVRAAETVGGVA